MTYEDYTTYTIVDEDNDITVDVNTLLIETMRRDANSYVIDDKEAGHFEDFEHLVKTKKTASDARAICLVWGVSNSNFTWKDMYDNTEGLGVFHYKTDVGTHRIYLSRFETGYSVDTYDNLLNTDYWLTIGRVSTALTCKIYSDAARTILLDTLAVTTDTTAYQYIIALGGTDDPGAFAANSISCEIEDLDLQEPEPISEATFTLAGTSYTVYLGLPLPAGEDNEISKEINRFNFWSGNYTIHDDGIAIQPLALTGIEITFAALAEFEKIDEMRDNNEEITISGLGDCMDGVYIIKGFKYKTIKKAINAYLWDIVLEKVRDS